MCYNATNYSHSIKVTHKQFFLIESLQETINSQFNETFICPQHIEKNHQRKKVNKPNHESIKTQGLLQNDYSESYKR